MGCAVSTDDDAEYIYKLIDTPLVISELTVSWINQ